MVSGATILDAAYLANIAGGLVCEKIGVVAIDKTRLLDEALRIGL